MTILSYIQLGIITAAFLVSLARHKALATKQWLPWIPFLLYTCVVEYWGAYIQAVTPEESNIWLYNPYIIVSIAFYAWFIIKGSLLRPRHAALLHTVFLVAPACVLIWYFGWGDRDALLKYVLDGGALALSLLCLLFFYTLIRNPIVHSSLARMPEFWIVAGVLVFYSGISIYVVVYDSLTTIKTTFLGTTLQNLIPQLLSLCLYGTVIIAFTKWTNPKSLS